MSKRAPGPFTVPPRPRPSAVTPSAIRPVRPAFSFTLYDHDLSILEGAKSGLYPNAVVVYVQCPHLLGLCYLMDDGMLADLPCPCNDRSTVLGVLLHDQKVLDSFGVSVGGEE